MRTPLLFLLLITATSGFAQTTVVLQPGPEQGYDAKIWDLGPMANFGTDPELIALSWNFAFPGEPGIFRGLLRYDLAGIPSNATILEAKLSLYHNPALTNPGHAGLNAARLERVTSEWDEESVTWSNQPTVDTNQVIRLPVSLAEDQDYLTIDVLDHVRQMVAAPSSNFGWLFRLEEEVPEASMKFCSSDCENGTRRPKLEITYTLDLTTCLDLQPDADLGKDALVWSFMPETNYGNHPDFMTYAWTFQFFEETEIRSYIGFDLGSIPAEATIQHAAISLYHNHESSNAGHAGDNAAFLSRVTESWEEDAINWNNQPAFTTEDEVLIPTSVYEDQDYLRLDVTDMIADMIAEPATGHGFMIRLVTPEILRSMKFTSSDFATDSSRRPRLEVCYTVPTSVKTIRPATVRVQPNPFTDVLAVRDLDGIYAVTITDATGRIVYRQDDMHFAPDGTSFDPRLEMAGVYILTLHREGEIRQQKVVRL
jgi:hypothetical protein